MDCLVAFLISTGFKKPDVGVRFERKKEVLDAYHGAVEKATPEKPKETEPIKGKSAAK